MDFLDYVVIVLANTGVVAEPLPFAALPRAEKGWLTQHSLSLPPSHPPLSRIAVTAPHRDAAASRLEAWSLQHQPLAPLAANPRAERA